MNRSGVRKTEYVGNRDILFCTNPCVAVGVIVNDTGVTKLTEQGYKYIPAGSAIGGTVLALNNRQTPLSYTPDGTGAQGVTQHDIVFYPNEGAQNANMIIFGFVDVDKMEADAAPQAGVITALMNKVTFIHANTP